MYSIVGCKGQDKLVKQAVRDLKIGALLVFIGVNLRLTIENIIQGLIYFHFLHPLGHGRHVHEYEVHVPNLPDMCGDVIMAMVFIFAYFFITSDAVQRVIGKISDNSSGLNHHDTRSFEQMAEWAKKLFFISIVGFSLYFFSKYFLSIGIETFLEEENGGLHHHHRSPIQLPFILNILNYGIQLGSILVFVTVYCKYLSANRALALMLYAFFFVRFLFASNMFGFVTQYDLFIGAPILDFLTPILIVYSVISVFIGL